MQSLIFSPKMLAQQPLSGLDVSTDLAHFSILTYTVDPAALRPSVHSRFELDCVRLADGSLRALISVVPFLDIDFLFHACPWPKWSFGQTNYRAYVTDSETGEHVVWFFGTTLDSIFVNIPRYGWQLPWHRGRIRFDVQYDDEEQKYSRYRMTTQSKWAAAELELEDLGTPPKELAGFSSLETAHVLLTHPLSGIYYRRDGKLGTYAIWHDKLNLTEGSIRRSLERRMLRNPDKFQCHESCFFHHREFKIAFGLRTLPA